MALKWHQPDQASETDEQCGHVNSLDSVLASLNSNDEGECVLGKGPCVKIAILHPRASISVNLNMCYGNLALKGLVKNYQQSSLSDSFVRLYADLPQPSGI